MDINGIIYDPLPLGAANIDIPLGYTHRMVLTIIGAVTVFVGFSSTTLLFFVSKHDLVLRQRGRYLVTGQGYAATVFVAATLFYQAYIYRFPCFLLFQASYLGLLPFVLLFAARGWRLITRYDRNQAIYRNRFVFPASPGTTGSSLDRSHSTASKIHFSPKPGSRSTDSNEHTKAETVGSGSTSNPSTPNTAVGSSPDFGNTQHDYLQEQVDRQYLEQHMNAYHPEDEELSKKWYNRYRIITDRQMLWFSLVFMAITVAIDIGIQVTSTSTPEELHSVSIVPMSYACGFGYEYYWSYFVGGFFLMVVSPIMVFQLRDLRDGFGIRNELITISLLGIPLMALYFILPVAAPDFSLNVLDRTTWTTLILMSSHFPAVLLPLFRHFRSRFTKRYSSDTASLPGTDRSGAGYSDNEGNMSGLEDGGEILAMPELKQEQALEDTKEYKKPSRMSTTNSTSSASNSNHENRSTSSPSNNNSNNNSTVGDLNGHITAGTLTSRPTNRTRKPTRQTDWASFNKALLDPEIFQKIGFFTVGEFCAENTRFLDEVARLEKRAAPYERLRLLSTAGPVDDGDEAEHEQEIQRLQKLVRTPPQKLDAAIVASGMFGPRGSPSTFTPAQTAAPSGSNSNSNNISHHQSTNNGSNNTMGSRLTPPLQMATGSSNGNNNTPRSVKKITSVSSVSSSRPMIGADESSTSINDISEPSSPLGMGFVMQPRQDPLGMDRYAPGPSGTYQPQSFHQTQQLQQQQAQQTSHRSEFVLRSSGASVSDSDTSSINDDAKGGQTDLNSSTSSISRPNPIATNAAPVPPLPMPPSLLAQFEYIYKAFISHGGRLELNLSYETSSTLHQKALRGQWHSKMFDKAVGEVKELLFRDVWPKFIATTAAQKLFQQRSRKESQQRQLHQQLQQNSLATALSPSSSGGTRHYQKFLASENSLQSQLPFWQDNNRGASGSVNNGSHQPPSSTVSSASSIDEQSPQQYGQPPLPAGYFGRGPGTSNLHPKASFSDLSRPGGNGGGEGSIGHLPLPATAVGGTADGGLHYSPQAAVSAASIALAEEMDPYDNQQRGFRTWVNQTKRKVGAVQTASIRSRESSPEESLGIIEQSRRSTSAYRKQLEQDEEEERDRRMQMSHR